MNYTETVYNETIEIKCIKYVIMDILIQLIFIFVVHNK